jgi:hypothetical protein
MGNLPITSTNNSTISNGATGQGDYSYSCKRDVTKLVQHALELERLGALNYPGNALYRVARGNSSVDFGDPGNEWSYAGWSLIIIYTSPFTKGHQLYLYDTFTYAHMNTDIDPTRETSGPGGVVSGFLVPQRIGNETYAANMTAFVGEGDSYYDGDFLAFNAPALYWNNASEIPDTDRSRLWDGLTLPEHHNTQAHPDNVWNSHAKSGFNDGVDIKTFNVTWQSGLLSEGDTSARIDLPTGIDVWNLVYMIFSFRSATTTGGNLYFLIR